MTDGGLAEARATAKGCLGGAGDRWRHVRVVGATAERVSVQLGLGSAIAQAAWLHDVGYSERIKESGFHPLDGARWLAERGWDSSVVALVAHHSGAAAEAEERGLARDLAVFTVPDDADLDVLNYADLTTGPDGAPLPVESRLDEILRRYPEVDPVHRAVVRSRASLIGSVRRVEARLRSADVGLGVDG